MRAFRTAAHANPQAEGEDWLHAPMLPCSMPQLEPEPLAARCPPPAVTAMQQGGVAWGLPRAVTPGARKLPGRLASPRYLAGCGRPAKASVRALPLSLARTVNTNPGRLSVRRGR